jgi:hypothetical protein
MKRLSYFGAIAARVHHPQRHLRPSVGGVVLRDGERREPLRFIEEAPSSPRSGVSSPLSALPAIRLPFVETGPTTEKRPPPRRLEQPEEEQSPTVASPTLASISDRGPHTRPASPIAPRASSPGESTRYLAARVTSGDPKDHSPMHAAPQAVMSSANSGATRPQERPGSRKSGEGHSPARGVQPRREPDSPLVSMAAALRAAFQWAGEPGASASPRAHMRHAREEDGPASSPPRPVAPPQETRRAGVHIGTIEVHVHRAPPLAAPARRPSVQGARGPASTGPIARGFTTTLGLRQS